METPAIDIDVVSSVAQFLIEVIRRHIQSTIGLHVTSQDKNTDTHCVIKFLRKCMHPSSTVLYSQSTQSLDKPTSMNKKDLLGLEGRVLSLHVVLLGRPL